MVLALKSILSVYIVYSSNVNYNYIIPFVISSPSLCCTLSANFNTRRPFHMQFH